MSTIQSSESYIGHRAQVFCQIVIPSNGCRFEATRSLAINSLIFIGCLVLNYFLLLRSISPLDYHRTTYAKVAGKYQDVLTLEQSVAELHQMFLDFALLTEQQGELLDQIEFQVKQAGDYVEEANVDVHQAIEYQKSIRKKQWYVVLGKCRAKSACKPTKIQSSPKSIFSQCLFFFSPLLLSSSWIIVIVVVAIVVVLFATGIISF